MKFPYWKTKNQLKHLLGGKLQLNFAFGHPQGKMFEYGICINVGDINTGGIYL